MQADFCVVVFDSDVVDYVSEKWLIGRTQCRWPNCSSFQIKRLRSQHAEPQKSWEIHSCKILSSTPCEIAARRRLKRAELGKEDLTTDIEHDQQQRLSLPPNRFINDTLIVKKKQTFKRKHDGASAMCKSSSESDQEELQNLSVPPFPQQSSE